jgi:hypothetical protein
MKAERDVDLGQQPARRSRASVVIVSVAFALLGYGVVTVAKHPSSVPGNSPALATSVAAASNAAGEASSMPVKEQNRLATLGDVQADPRECEPAKGINTQCIFE